MHGQRNIKIKNGCLVTATRSWQRSRSVSQTEA